MEQSKAVPRLAATYAAYAAEVSHALQTLLDTMRVNVEPAVDFVSCGAGLHEHFVPKASLEKHLWKCHGVRKPLIIHNAAFYYGNFSREIAQGNSTQHNEMATFQDGCHGELPSLLEPNLVDYEDKTEPQGVLAAMQRASMSAHNFYSQVQAWPRIPRSFAHMLDNERSLLETSTLRRWLHTELSRPGILPSSDDLDEEVVDYVLGLLDHPDFCHPDQLVKELHEFLGSHVINIVLALWKFMVVEIGLHSVFSDEKSSMSNTIQATSLVPIRASLLKPTEAERDFKRRRESYKKKIGTKTGLAAYRELIQKHMIELSLETNRELVLGGGFSSDTKAHIPKQAHRRVVDWWNFTDALKVRNRSRRMSRDDTRSQLRHSKSRSRHRCRTKRHFCTNVKDTTDRRYKSRSRSRDTKTRRLYMDDSARYSARYRRQSDSKNRDRSPDRRHMYTKS